MENVTKCLCLLSDSAVCKLAQWYESPQPTPIIQPSGGWGSQAMEHVFQSMVDPRDYDEVSAQFIVQKFLDLTDIERQRLEIPLSRLNTAFRGSNPAEIALDVGIAIEALVGDPRSQTEISYRVRQRGTLLLGGTGDEKRKTFQYLKELYDLRSKVAHGGRLESSDRMKNLGIQTDAFLRECCVLCSKMIKKVLDAGVVADRDWDGALLGW